MDYERGASFFISIPVAMQSLELEVGVDFAGQPNL
jgi:hypothetical protein